MKSSAWLVLLAATALPAVAGEASGKFETTGRDPIRPTHAGAFETRDPRNPHKRIVEIVLSDAPVDAAAAAADLDPSQSVVNQDALVDHDYILLWVRPGNDVSMNATYGARMTQFVDMTPGALKAEIAALTPDRVAGRLWSPQPVETQDGSSWTVDVHFATDVAHAPAGTKLPADGGAPGSAFRAFVKSTKELPLTLPKKGAKVVGGERRGDVAILEVEGQMFASQKALYLVRMKQSGAAWTFDRATVAGLID